jgi:Sulfotransferase family
MSCEGPERQEGSGDAIRLVVGRRACPAILALMRREQLPSEPKRSYVLPRYKVVYVSTPKAACTSLKWVMAELGGEDLGRFGEVVIRPGTTPAAVIHPRRFWQHTPRLHRLTDEQLAEIDGANGWHIFAVVRHPAMRLWSAWQEKLLLREPHMAGKVPDRLVPPLPRSTADVVEAFQTFVASMTDPSCSDVMEDPHFLPQHEVLAAARMPYTRVYTTGEIDQAMSDLDKRVRAEDGGSVPALLSTNETPLKPLRSMFSEEVLTTISKVYEADFRTWFRDADLAPPGAIDDREYPSTQLTEVCRLVDRHVRIGQLATLAERLQRENQALRTELARLRT